MQNIKDAQEITLSHSNAWSLCTFIMLEKEFSIMFKGLPDCWATRPEHIVFLELANHNCNSISGISHWMEIRCFHTVLRCLSIVLKTPHIQFYIKPFAGPLHSRSAIPDIFLVVISFNLHCIIKSIH